MNIVEVEVKKLKPYENNPRFNEDAVEYVAKSIKEFGFKVPIIIDKNNEIIAGHTRLKASLKLGLNKVPCIIADDLTDEQVRAFRLADNKVSDYSIWNNMALLTELEYLKDIDIFTGFDFSENFEDILDETDTSIFGEREEEKIYIITIKSSDKLEIDMVKQFCECNGINYE